jgi:hypothetical protein
MPPVRSGVAGDLRRHGHARCAGARASRGSGFHVDAYSIPNSPLPVRLAIDRADGAEQPLGRDQPLPARVRFRHSSRQWSLGVVMEHGYTVLR